MKVNFSGMTNFDLSGEQIFYISAAEENEKYNNVSFTLVNKNGAKKFENFGVYDERGLKAFFGFCKAVLGEVGDEIDCKELVGKYVKFTCEKYTYDKDDGTKKTVFQKVKGTYYESVAEEEKFTPATKENATTTQVVETNESTETSDVDDVLSQLNL